MKTLFIYIKSFFDFFILKVLQSINSSVKKKSNNILFINTGQIGDLVISSAIFENDKLLNNYSNSYFLMREEYRELFADYKGIIKIIGIDYNAYRYNYLYRIQFNYKLRQYSIKIVYNLTSARPTWNDTLALGIGAKEKYCYENNWESVKKVFEIYTDKRYSGKMAVGIFNEYDRINYLIELLSIKQDEKNFNKTNFFRIRSNNEKYDIIIAPFSSDENRDVKIDSINKIMDKFNKLKILILCSLKQLSKLNQLNKSKNVSIAAGEYKLSKLFSVINNSKIFVGVDSGLTHIALKTNTKVIALIGGGNYGRYLPKPNDNKSIYLTDYFDCFGCEWHCIKEKMFCIENITAEKIIDEISNTLN